MMNELKNIRYFINVQLRQMVSEQNLKSTSPARSLELEKTKLELIKSRDSALTYFKQKQIVAKNNQWFSLIKELKDEKVLSNVVLQTLPNFSLQDIGIIRPKKVKKEKQVKTT